MLNRRETSLIASALFALGCGGNAVDVGHSQSRGWTDAPAEDASTTTPQTIYQSEELIFGFALDDDTLYALIVHHDTFELVSCPLERCRSARKVLFSGPYPETGLSETPLLLSDGWLYWRVNGDFDALAGCPTTGCTQLQVVQTRSNGPLAADSEGVYWIDREKSSLMRLTAGIETPEPVRDLNAEMGDGASLAARGDYLYVGSNNETIQRFRKDGAGDLELIATDEMVVAFAVTADDIYYSSQLLTGRVVRCPLAGCAANGQTLAANQRWPEEIQVEGNEAFWLTNPHFSQNVTHSTLHSCQLPECASVQERVPDLPGNDIVNYQQQGSTFAVSQRALVWLEPISPNGTNLRRLAR